MAHQRQYPGLYCHWQCLGIQSILLWGSANLRCLKSRRHPWLQPSPNIPSKNMSFFHNLLLVHILYCFFHIHVLLTWVPFYVLSFQALVTLRRKTLELAGSGKSRVCFLTTGLCFWGLCRWAVTQGVRRKSTSAENSLEAKYMCKISTRSVTFPN